MFGLFREKSRKIEKNSQKGNKREKEVEVVVVDPQRDLDLTLDEDLETDLVPTRSR